MCRQIPWSTFLLALALVGGGYYLVVGVLFYRKDILGWFVRRRSDREAEKKPAAVSLPEAVSDNELSRDTDRAGDPSA